MAKASDVNCGPLSETTCYGKHRSERINSFLNNCSVHNNHFQPLSISIHQDAPRQNQYEFVQILERAMHNHGCKGATWGAAKQS